MSKKLKPLVLLAACVVTASTLLASEPPSVTQQEEFFENRIRPVLVEHCYECHNSHDAAEGGLAVDQRDALRRGGDGGPTFAPGSPADSRLLAVLRHEIDGLEMPDGGAKLDAGVIADFEKWIAWGALDPRTTAPTAEELAAATAWEATRERRKQWWSFQPIARVPLPEASQPAVDPPHPIDAFLQRELEQRELTPVAAADAATLVRRLFFNLIGLPPSSAQARQWTARLQAATDTERKAVIEELVDELLASPRFGERWARHWMDWIRYAESHGSEGDPVNDNAWMYRDYLVRALNTDVAYDQLLREHVAGDLLPEPRRNEELQINESAIAPAHWRMVFHGFAPTDALDEKVRFTDDQINAFSKAFLGLTISCARCHHHKFDAISQDDYYAMFGVLASCRPGRTVIDLPEPFIDRRAQLDRLKIELRAALAADWSARLDELSATITDRVSAATDPSAQLKSLAPLVQCQEMLRQGKSFEEAWSAWSAAHRSSPAAALASDAPQPIQRWRMSQPSAVEQWFKYGWGLGDGPQAAGDFAVAPTGANAVVGIYPAGVYSHMQSDKLPARFSSGNVQLTEACDVWVRAIGDPTASLRYVVQDYPRNGTVYPVTGLSPEWQWHKFDLTYWQGDSIHLELAAAKDAPLLVKDQPRSWFGIRDAMLVAAGQPPPNLDDELFQPLLRAADAAPPRSLAELTEMYVAALEATVEHWAAGELDDAQALWLDRCVRDGLLPNELQRLPQTQPLLTRYRAIENELPIATRVPGVEETIAHDQPLFMRGNHKQPGHVVPRRFLEAIDPTPYSTQLSGRLELAEDLLRDDNPLTRRVIVNRLWHHLFGRGLVATPDNLGRLGVAPTHPELLDWLANRFVDDGWSLKSMIRLIVTSQAWQRSSQATPALVEADPENQWLARAHVRRLEAEAIRDSLLAVAGRLTHRSAGPPVPGDAPQRSIYVRVHRNALDPFLRVFDFPEPFTAVGRRDVTTVPAQSLTLMNDPVVIANAQAWARAVPNFRLPPDTEPSDENRVREMFLTAFGRAPTEQEVATATGYLNDTRVALEENAKLALRLKSELAEKSKTIKEMLAVVRERLLQEIEGTRGKAVPASTRELVQPIARWEFETDLRDSIGSAHGEIRGGAKLSDGALVVEHGGHVVTSPLATSLREKTLEAWVQLPNLAQSGGGVISLQTLDGSVFDAIVFAEQSVGQWLAGSNSFARTQPFNGPVEQEADDGPVHIAITYAADGTIQGYRNGLPYGQAYHSSGPIEFQAGRALVSFGLRHLPAGGNRLLSGRILEARLYDRALSTAQIERTAAAGPTIVSDSQVLAALSPEQTQQLDQLRRDVAELESALREVRAEGDGDSNLAAFSDLARALFTFQEFIYVR